LIGTDRSLRSQAAVFLGRDGAAGEDASRRLLNADVLAAHLFGMVGTVVYRILGRVF
jgi:hypothetical protein